MMKGEILLTTSALDVGYPSRGSAPNVVLFRNLNLELSGGRMVCFMGPNGAGKSSLLRTLAGVQKPLAGTVGLRNTGGDRSRQIALVLTDRISELNFTVEEVVSFGRYPYLGWNVRLNSEDRDMIRSAISQVHIEHLAGRKIYELSDGQMQMVMIARALAQDTPVILLDEPTAHLDLNNRVEIMNLLRELSRAAGKAILLATHELDLALQTADLVWLTGQNEDILSGVPEDLVLSSVFDTIFELKGFDLKTGKVLHVPFRDGKVQLLGQGPVFLWTKNALERNGYFITQDKHAISVSVDEIESKNRWIIRKPEGEFTADTIEKLLNLI